MMTIPRRNRLGISACLLVSCSLAEPVTADDSGLNGLLNRLVPGALVKTTPSNLRITGLDSRLEDNVRAFLSLQKEDCAAPRWRIERLFEQADTEIGKALRALGYYHPEIEKKLTINDACWIAEFVVGAGPPVKIATVDIRVSGEAEFDPAFDTLLNKASIKTGQVLNHGRYEALKKSFQSLAQERGYFDGKFAASAIEVDTERNEAAIVLSFSSGPRYFFGDVAIEQDRLDPDFIQRFIPFKPDEPYSSRKLADAYNNLTAGNYFRTVEIQPQIDDAAELRVPITIALYPEKQHNYEAGVGYDTNFGPLFSLGYTNRRFNQRGHTFNAALDFSPILSTAEAKYNIPLQNPNRDFFSLGAGFKHEEPDTFRSDMFKLSAQQQHNVLGGWQQIVFLDAVYESFESADAADMSAFLLVPGIRMQYTTSNSQIRPTEGYHVNFSLAGAHEAALSDVSFFQIGGGARWITGVPWSGRFIMRGDIGATWVSDFAELPASYRFYAGGMQSIRGYEYKELGPANAAGQVVGGNRLTTLSLEYEQFIDDAWGVAAFVDAGNAYNDFDIDVKIGAGVGLRWISPVGPLRIDFAVPFHESGSSFQIHFAAGTQL
ncbi:MAG: autotransporter assembly complex family protein [Methylomicrobium sp.]